MSTVFPITKQTTPVTTAHALTGAYVVLGKVSLDTQNFVGIAIRYTKGDETSVQLKVESSVDAGTTWDQSTTESASGGTVTVSLAERSFTGSGNYNTILYPLKADQVRFSMKATGGTPTGTVTIVGMPSWV